MRVWLITVGEPLPIDGPNERLHRTGIIVNLLIKRGHKVIWWTSTFDHVRKKQRFNTDTNIKVSTNFETKLLHSIGYRKNISISRFINHYLIGCKFLKYARKEHKPDIILSSLPTLKLSLSAVKYGRKIGIPVVLDMRDMWPDLFLDFVPSWAKIFVNFLFLPFYYILHSACDNATCITGITPNFVKWGISHTNRLPTSFDRSFPLGYSEISPSEEAVKRAEQFWAKYGLNKNKNEFIICFFGNMGRMHRDEILSVINAIKRINIREYLFWVVMAGRGENLSFYKSEAKKSKNIIFPGWVNKAQIWTLMRMSSFALLPCQNNKNYRASFPNKSIEYLSAGLPIVSSLKGALEDLLNTYNCGITYKSENAEDLASKLIYLFNHPKILKEMSKNAYTLYKDKFVAEKVYSDMIDYLELVVKNYKKQCM